MDYVIEEAARPQEELCHMGIKFTICMANAQETAQLLKLLQAWAEENCVDIQAIEAAPDLLGSIDISAETGALLLADSTVLHQPVLEVLAKIQHENTNLGVLLVSDNPDFAIDAYQCHPDGLIEKPIRWDRLCAALDRCFRCWQKGQQWLDLPFQHRRVRLPLGQVRYAEAVGRNSVLYCTGGAIQVNCSLGVLMEQLPQPPFLRCQKGFAVHLGAVQKIVGGELIMEDNQTISAARGQLRQIRAAYAVYQQQRGGT